MSIVSGITVVITTVGSPRRHYLRRALESVYAQTLQPDSIVITQDHERRGAARNRQRGTDQIRTPWVAYLDDDDEFYPQHLSSLLAHAIGTSADLVFPWFDVVGGADPFPEHFGRPWDDRAPVQVPVTFLARTDAIRHADGWDDGAGEDGQTDPEGNRAGEDWRLVLRLVDRGRRIVHLPERTWAWHHDSGNSSGLPSRIDWDRVG